MTIVGLYVSADLRPNRRRRKVIKHATLEDVQTKAEDLLELAKADTMRSGFYKNGDSSR